MSVEKLINWRQISKLVSKNKSETAIQMYNCPKKYYTQIDALLIALQNWHREHIEGKSPERKYTITEIKEQLDGIR